MGQGRARSNNPYDESPNTDSTYLKIIFNLKLPDMEFKQFFYLSCIALVILAGFTAKAKLDAPVGDYDFLRKRIEDTKTYTVDVIKAMPEADYKYKPTDAVRSYAAQAFHIVYTIEWFLPKLKGNPVKWNPGDEERMSKTDLVKYADEQFDALKAFINEAESSPKLTDEIINLLNHNAHHRGQMTTYLRMKSIKPPKYR